MSPEAKIQTVPEFTVSIDLTSTTSANPANEAPVEPPLSSEGPLTREDRLKLKVGDSVRTGVLCVETCERTETIRDVLHYVLTSYDVHGRKERSVTEGALLRMGAVKE